MISVLASGEFLEDVVERVHDAPGHVDVALTVLKESFAERLAWHALPLDQVEASHVRRIPKDARLVAAGFPNQFTHNVAASDGVVSNLFVDIILHTFNHDHDDKLISFAWKRADVIEWSPQAPPDGLSDRPLLLRKAVGISGGPLYLVKPTTRAELPTLTSHLRLVGVLVRASNGQRQTASPWWHWAAWLRSTMASSS